MTDEQIINALECCVRYENHMACRGCPFNESGVCEADGLALQKYSLDLVKRQQAEIEVLKKAGNKIDSLGLVAALTDQRERLIRAKNEWEREVRAEAVREFAERLKELSVCGTIREYSDANNISYMLEDMVSEDIDNLAKEMTEKEGADNA